MKNFNKYQFNIRRVFSLIPAATLFLLLAGGTSCKEETDNPYIHINPFEMVQVANNGAEAFLAVETNLEDWTFVADGDWLTGSVTAEGILLKAEPNPNGSDRRTLLHIVSAAYPIANKSVSVIQSFTYLNIKPENLPPLSANGTEVDINVDTNAEDWTVNVTEGDWLTAAKSANGFKLTAQKNEGYVSRTAVVTVSSTIYEIERIMEISQIADFKPYLTITPATDQTLPRNGGQLDITVDTNIDDWDFTVDSWLTGEKTATGIRLTFEKYYGSNRTGTLTVSSPAYPETDVRIQLSQTGGYTVKGNIYKEDFNWLDGPVTIWGTAAEGGHLAEVALASWNNTFQKGGEWTKTGSTEIAWSRAGWVKVGRSGRCGDLISPAITTIQGLRDVKVSFKACGFLSASGAKDPTSAAGDSKYMSVEVEVLGPGTIIETAQFPVSNFPDHTITAGDNWQARTEALRSFIIVGISSETKIQFKMGRDIGTTTADGATYRFGFDDFQIDEIE
jgi:hypothetical protein